MMHKCPVFSGVPRQLRLYDFLMAEGVPPDTTNTMGPLTVITYRGSYEAKEAQDILKLYGWKTVRHGGMICLSDRIEGNPFVDQRVFQHVFQSKHFESPEEFYALYRELITEELKELDAATTPEEHLDAIIDLLYVTIGAGNALGYDLQGAWDAVHTANMAKAGPDGKAIFREDGKVLKPSDWVPPVLTKFYTYVLKRLRPQEGPHAEK